MVSKKRLDWEQILFITITSDRLQISFNKGNKIKLSDISLKKEKYLIDDILKKQLKDIGDKTKRDVLVMVIEDYKHQNVHELYHIHNVTIKNNRNQETLELSFKNSKLRDLTHNESLKEILSTLIINYQHLDPHFRAFAIGTLKFLLKKNSNISLLEKELNASLDQFSLRVPCLKPLFECLDIPLNLLRRHLIIFGETGSGKTYSVLFPLIDVLSEKVGQFSALVIDPKQNELQNRFVQGLPKNKASFFVHLNDLDKSNPQKKIDIFEGLRNRQLHEKLDFLFKISPRFKKQESNTNDAFWTIAARSLIENLVLLDGQIREKGEINLPTGKKIKVNDLFDFFHKTIKQMSVRKALPIKSRQPYFSKLKGLVSWMAEKKSEEEKIANINDLFNLVLTQNGLPEIKFFNTAPIDTFNSIVAVSQPFFEDWTNSVCAQLLWSDPFKSCPKTKTFSLLDAITKGKILIYSIPSHNISEDHYRVGKLIKTKFFGFCFETHEEREKSGITTFYIADEFHRFITGDEDSGEQSFLDRCRAYNVTCVLATQSISSLKYGISENSGSETDANLSSSLETILNNCGTKFFFRTTDFETNQKLKELIPQNPFPSLQKLGHVIDVFPVSTLSVGQCYFFTPRGTWGRTRIKVD